MKFPFAKIIALVLCIIGIAPPARAIEGPSNVKGQGNAAAVQRGDEAELAGYTKALAENPADDKRAALLFNRGRVYMKLNQDDKALEDFDSVIAIHPNDGFAHTMRGNILFGKGRLDAAMEEYDTVIRLEPKNYKMHGNRALIHYSRGEYDEAIEEYTTAINMAPEVAMFYNDRAGVYEQMGRNDDALKDYNDAIRLNPNFPGALTNRAELFNHLHDPVKAFADFAQAIRVDPDYFWAYLRRGDMHKDLGESGPAIDDFRRAAQLDPKSAYSFNQLAWVLATAPDDKVRDGKAALEAAKRAVALGGDPGYEDTLAAAYAEAGDFENAIKTEQHYLDTYHLNGMFGKWARERLALYQLGKPFHEKKKEPGKDKPE